MPMAIVFGLGTNQQAGTIPANAVVDDSGNVVVDDSGNIILAE